MQATPPSNNQLEGNSEIFKKLIKLKLILSFLSFEDIGQNYFKSNKIPFKIF